MPQHATRRERSATWWVVPFVGAAGCFLFVRLLRHRRGTNHSLAALDNKTRNKIIQQERAAAIAARQTMEQIGGHKTIHVGLVQDCSFRALTQLNCDEGRACAGRKHRLSLRCRADASDSRRRQQLLPVLRWFPGDSLTHRLARSLAQRNAIDMKEFAESMEFFHNVRSHMKRSKHVVDLCCGHGFTGILFAVFVKGVDEVLLLDRKKPQSYTAIYESVVEVAPWVAQKVKFVEVDLKTVLELSEKGFASESGPHDESSLVLPTRAAFLSVHACNEATDLSIQIAINCRAASVASMPCCYYSQPIQNQAAVVKQVFGKEMAIDLERTNRLHNAGYRVSWKVIPLAVTPKNRIILAMGGQHQGQNGTGLSHESAKQRRKREWKAKKKAAKLKAQTERAKE